jgi:hypothetical protein
MKIPRESAEMTALRECAEMTALRERAEAKACANAPK